MPPDFVVPDANVLIALCAKETDKFAVADAQMQKYAAVGCMFNAPGVLVAEVLYILCGKLMRSVLSSAEHSIAVQTLQAQMQSILPPPGGDAALVTRAEQIRGA